MRKKFQTRKTTELSYTQAGVANHCARATGLYDKRIALSVNPFNKMKEAETLSVQIRNKK